MPKVKWGGDEVATATDIDEAELGFQPYAGEIPPSSVYRFRLVRAKKFIFGTGNQGLKLLLELDGSWKPAHGKFDGCPLWTNVVNTKAAAAFVRAFCEAIGVTSKDFLNATVVDADDVVTSIGRTKIAGAEILVYCNVKRSKYEEDGPWRLEGVGTTFLSPPEPVEETEAEAEDEVEDAPKKGKGKKGKKGKATAAAEDGDPPF